MDRTNAPHIHIPPRRVAWLLALPLVLAAGWLPLTAIGTGAIVGLILVTTVFAIAQWLGLRRLG